MSAVYNRERYLQETILHQAYPTRNTSLDDGLDMDDDSTVDTAEIIKKYE